MIPPVINARLNQSEQRMLGELLRNLLVKQGRVFGLMEWGEGSF